MRERQQLDKQYSLATASPPVDSSIFPPVLTNEASTEDKLNYGVRCLEDGRFLGKSAAIAVEGIDYEKGDDSADAINFKIQLENVVGSVGGFFLGLILHGICYYFYRRNRSLNPLYRNFKTLASAGTVLGNVISSFLPIPSGHPQKILTNICIDICGLALGLFALPFWAFRRFSKSKYELEVPYEVPEDKEIDFEKIYIYVKDGELEYAAINQKGILERRKLTKKDLGQHYSTILSTITETENTQSLDEEQMEALFVALGHYDYVRKFKNPYTKLGNEGWSKYGKTFLVYGLSLGQIIGVIYACFVPVNMLASMAIFGGITALVTFVGSLALIPLINWLTNGALTTKSRDKFRNNYIRTGMTLGLAVGSVLGFIIGSLVPGLGIVVGMAIFSAAFSIILGAAIGASGYQLSEKIHGKWRNIEPCEILKSNIKPKEDNLGQLSMTANMGYVRFRNRLYYVNRLKKKVTAIEGLSDAEIREFDRRLEPARQRILAPDELSIAGNLSGYVHFDTGNSFCYASRGLAYFFAYIGTIVGLFLPVPGGMFVGAALGAAIGSMVGWFAGLLVVEEARRISPNEEKTNLPWTQRLATGSSAFAVIGAGIGFGLGFLGGGPAGAVFGMMLGLAIGGIVGGIGGILFDKVGRKMIWQALFGVTAENKEAIPEKTGAPSPAPSSTPIISKKNSFPKIQVPIVSYEESTPAISPFTSDSEEGLASVKLCESSTSSSSHARIAKQIKSPSLETKSPLTTLKSVSQSPESSSNIIIDGGSNKRFSTPSPVSYTSNVSFYNKHRSDKGVSSHETNSSHSLNLGYA